MSQFTEKLEVAFIDGKLWRLLKSFWYDVGEEDSGERVIVIAGFLTDFASVPRFAWPIIGHPTGRYGKASVVHDWLYRYPKSGVLTVGQFDMCIPIPRTRRRCDQIFLEGMQVLGISWWKRTVMYSAVRVGGGKPWKQYRSGEE